MFGPYEKCTCYIKKQLIKQPDMKLDEQLIKEKIVNKASIFQRMQLTNARQAKWCMYVDGRNGIYII